MTTRSIPVTAVDEGIEVVAVVVTQDHLEAVRVVNQIFQLGNRQLPYRLANCFGFPGRDQRFASHLMQFTDGLATQGLVTVLVAIADAQGCPIQVDKFDTATVEITE